MPIKDPNDVWKEFYKGTLHSGKKRSGIDIRPIVKDKKQALAIFLSEKRKFNKK